MLIWAAFYYSIRFLQFSLKTEQRFCTRSSITILLLLYIPETAKLTWWASKTTQNWMYYFAVILSIRIFSPGFHLHEPRILKSDSNYPHKILKKKITPSNQFCQCSQTLQIQGLMLAYMFRQVLLNDLWIKIIVLTLCWWISYTSRFLNCLCFGVFLWSYFLSSTP